MAKMEALVQGLNSENREVSHSEELYHETPHRVEHTVRRQLLEHPQLAFSSLVIRRLNDGVCLQGVLELGDAQTEENIPDICEIVRQVSGLNEVLNRLVVRRTSIAPKG